MKIKKVLLAVFVLLIISIACACQINDTRKHEPATEEIISILEKNPEIKSMLIKSIEMAKEINPDKKTNPAQSLEEYYTFLDWSMKATPWNVLDKAQYPTFFEYIDQGIDYFYFILDQPLPELQGKGYYYNSLQYVEELRPWLVKCAKNWGEYLSTKESWKPEYYDLFLKDARFNLDKGWYEDPSNWHSFNDFFARHLSGPSARPIMSPNDNSVIVSPCDSSPQGIWKIDENSSIMSSLRPKSTEFSTIKQLLGEESSYVNAFAGGTLTHTFLNIDDYHRFHFPVSGIIREVRMIPAQEAAGGITTWDKQNKKYVLNSSEPGWQSIETRACVVLETPEYGLVAVMPIGMSQISSIVLESYLKPGVEVKKGDMLGCFQFGGSDVMMIFQKDVNFSLSVPMNGHVLMGEEYGRLSKTHQS